MVKCSHQISSGSQGKRLVILFFWAVVLGPYVSLQKTASAQRLDCDSNRRYPQRSITISVDVYRESHCTLDTAQDSKELDLRLAVDTSERESFAPIIRTFVRLRLLRIESGGTWSGKAPQNPDRARNRRGSPRSRTSTGWGIACGTASPTPCSDELRSEETAVLKLPTISFLFALVDRLLPAIDTCNAIRWGPADCLTCGNQRFTEVKPDNILLHIPC
jgi:hypothetical protein